MAAYAQHRYARINHNFGFLIRSAAKWVVGLLQGLIDAKKFTVLARITLKSVEPGNYLFVIQLF